MLLRFLNFLHQIAAVTELNLRTIPERLGSSAAAVVGVAGVVAVFVAVLSIAEGFRAAMVTAGSPDTAIVMRAGTDSEMTSILGRDDVRIIEDAPGILRGPQGPLASAELFVIVDLPKRSTGTDANVPLRGVDDAAFAVRRRLRIVAGRRFEPGRNEIVVGEGAAREFRGLDLGSTLRFGENTWTVVGMFSTGGTVADSELWCDTKVLQGAYRRGTSYQAVYAKLASAEAFPQFKDALTSDPRLNVKVVRETEYYAEQSSTLYGLIRGVGTVIAVLMGIGAVFGALNTMYTAVAARTREIATLRALGFGGGPLVLAFLAESVVLALVGGLLGAGLAFFAFDGFHTATMNWRSFSQVAFAFAVTRQLLVQGISYALVMGLLGGIFPAIRAARLPVAAALRAL